MNWYERGIVALAVAVFGIAVLAALTNNVSLWSMLAALGEEGLCLVLAILAYYASPGPLPGLVVLVSVLMSGSLNIAIKYSLNTPRPPNPLVDVQGPGFPSGHAQVSASFWTALALTRRKTPFFSLSVAAVLAVSLSRVYLRAHYEVDVIGGLALGVLAGLLAYLVLIAMARTGQRARTLVAGLLVLAPCAHSALYSKAVLEPVGMLMGLGAALILLSLTRIEHVDLSSLRVTGRLAGFIASSALLIITHYATLETSAVIRVLGFAASGIASLSLIPRILCYSKCTSGKATRPGPRT